MPDQFPPDCPEGCPPEDAKPAEGEFWRICRTNPPTSADFDSHAEKNIMPKADPCKRCGVSVLPSRRDAKHTMEMFEGILGEYLAVAVLTPDHGFVKQTGKPPHHTWWPFKDLDRLELFTQR